MYGAFRSLHFSCPYPFLPASLKFLGQGAVALFSPRFAALLPAQLSVIRALLTFTTAEHFLAHGDSLMSAVRAVFNLALGSESEDIKRTACNALLQVFLCAQAIV